MRLHNQRVCMDVAGARRHRGTAVVGWSCHRGYNQQWTLTPRGEIKSRLNGTCGLVGDMQGPYPCAAGYCLDIAGYHRPPGGRLIMWPCHNGLNQRWWFDHLGRLRSRLNNLCIYGHPHRGHGLRTVYCNGSPWMRWKFIR